MAMLSGPAIADKWKKVIDQKDGEGNEVTFLVNGIETFQSYLEAIRTTSGKGHYIYLLGWSFDGDVPLDGKTSDSSMSSLLTMASGKGVQIRMMLWRPKSWDINKISKWINFVNKLENGAGIADSNTIKPDLGSHHQKVLLVKGSSGLLAFCGGIDIHPDRVQTVATAKVPAEYDGQFEAAATAGSPYSDVHCRIQGNAAKFLVDVFMQRWEAHPDHVDLDKPPKKGTRGKGPLLGAIDRYVNATSNDGEKIVGIKRTFNFPAKKNNCIVEQSIKTAMVSAIRAASSFIYIEDQYLISMQAAEELKNRLPNLQHLTILVPASQISDLPRVWELRANFVSKLYEAPGADKKVRIFYKVTPGTGLDTPPKFGPYTYVHSKTWIFDDQLAVIGSANCNRRGWESDSEVAALIFDKANAMNPTDYSFAQKLRIALWKKHLQLEKDTDVWNGLVHASKWLETAQDKTSGIRKYDPKAGKDNPLAKKYLSLNIIDPTTDGLKQCGQLFPPPPGDNGPQ